MALYRFFLPRIRNQICCSLFHFQCNFKYLSSTENSATVHLQDVIDNFTIQLIQKKIWDMKSKKLQHMKLSLKNKHFVTILDIKNSNIEQLDEVFNCALVECNDTAVVALMRECLKLQMSPSSDYIVQVMSICAQNGEVELIDGLKILCKQKDINLPTNFSFEIYNAHAVWIKGHVMKALNLFEELYITNPFLRRHIRIILKQLISVEVKKSSEAVLINMLKVAKNIKESHNDYSFLTYIWESCFLSELFSDQQLAIALLYEDQKLVEVLAIRLPIILYKTLKIHRTESIYKLLEYFHVMNMEEECTIVAMAFLDYYFLQVNVVNYSEVIKWCKNCNIVLPAIYNEKYLDLLLNVESSSTPQNKPKVEKYNTGRELSF